MEEGNFFVWNTGPILFTAGPLQLRWYGLLFASAFIFGFSLMTKMYTREGKSIETLDFLLTYMVVGTLLGARLGHCLFYEPDYYLSNPIEIMKFWRGGLASHGAAVGIFLSLYIYSLRNPDQPYLWLCSRMCITVASGGFFIRLGNFFNSEIVGLPSTVPWAVVFSRVDNLPRHPTQLYESISYLLIFFILYGLYKRSEAKIAPAKLLGLFFVLVFGARFVLEYTKEFQVAFANLMPMRMGQVLSIPIVLIGLCLILFSSQKSKVKEA